MGTAKRFLMPRVTEKQKETNWRFLLTLKPTGLKKPTEISWRWDSN